MRAKRTGFVGFCAAIALVAVTLMGSAAAASPSFELLLDDLSSPKGLTATPNGNPIVAQGAFGPPGPVLEYLTVGRNRGETVELTDPVPLVDVAAATNGTGWAIGFDEEGNGLLYRRDKSGAVEVVLNITAYQVGDPDPYDQEGFPEESNPFGLAVLPNGDAVIADAANNDIVRVNRHGEATTIARFDTELVATDHLPFPFPAPFMASEAVPTSIAVGRGGMLYVGELQGFPFRPGTSDIWAINPNAEGALCSHETPDPDCQLHLSGFTGIADLDVSRNGTFYVYEYAADGLLAFEAGFETGVFPPAVLLKVKGGQRTELAAGELSQPGGVVVGRGADTVYVTDSVFTGGRLIRIDG